MGAGETAGPESANPRAGAPGDPVLILRAGPGECLWVRGAGGVERPVPGDPHRLPFLDDCFAGCSFEAGAAELAAPVIAFREARRVLRPGGEIRVAAGPAEAAELAWLLTVAGFDRVRPGPEGGLVGDAPVPGLVALPIP